MSDEAHDPEWYLRDPRMRKWMARCAACATVGVRDGAPPDFFGSKHFEGNFEAPRLNRLGLCDVCAEALQATAPIKNRE